MTFEDPETFKKQQSKKVLSCLLKEHKNRFQGMFIPPISWMLKSMNGLHLQGHLELNYTALHLMLYFSIWESFPGRAFLNKDED